MLRGAHGEPVPFYTTYIPMNASRDYDLPVHVVPEFWSDFQAMEKLEGSLKLFLILESSLRRERIGTRVLHALNILHTHECFKGLQPVGPLWHPKSWSDFQAMGKLEGSSKLFLIPRSSL